MQNGEQKNEKPTETSQYSLYAALWTSQAMQMKEYMRLVSQQQRQRTLDLFSSSAFFFLVASFSTFAS